MPHRLLITLAALIATMSLTQLPAASAASSSASTGGTKIALHKTSKGTILVDSHGFTLYAFTLDTPTKDACAGILECLTLWPAVTTPGKVIAGHGVKKSLIKTIKFRGRRQITYAGHPLYTYAQDTKPAQTSNINILQFQGRWPALNAAGKLIK